MNSIDEYFKLLEIEMTAIERDILEGVLENTDFEIVCETCGQEKFYNNKEDEFFCPVCEDG